MSRVCGGNIRLDDDEKIVFGTDEDYEMYWDSTSNSMVGISEGGGDGIFRYILNMQDVIYPTNADWDINTGAPLSVDTNDGSLVVRRFDDSQDEAIGWYFYIPSTVTNISITLVSRPETAPGAEAGVDVDFSIRPIPNGSAVGSWSQEADGSLTIPTNENWNYDNIVNESLSTFSMTAGLMHQMQLNRDVSSGLDTLTGDWTLLQIIIEFS